jgi:orotidine-5'-phosphate decarboxylase
MSEKLLYVALDGDKDEVNRDLAARLAESDAEGDFGFKINLDQALIWGRSYIDDILANERPVFVDLKINNGPRTMANTIAWLGSMGVSHTNVWANAGSNLAKTMDQLSIVDNRPKVLGMLFYTRWDDEYTIKNYDMPLNEYINHWGNVAVDSGADGLIVPPNHLSAVSEIDTTKLSPGIRMADQETDSAQEQVSGPYEAIMAGSDILVVGSPIYKADDPVRALKAFLGEIRRAETDLGAEERA